MVATDRNITVSVTASLYGMAMRPSPHYYYYYYTVSTKKTKPENVQHNFLGGLIPPSLLRTQLHLYFQRSLCNSLTPRCFILMMSCRTETENVS